MSTQHNPHSEQYERARKEFDDLKVEDRAVFLLEATVSTIARGLEDAGRFLAEQLDNLFKTGAEAARKAEEAGKEPQEPPAPTEPPPVDVEGL